MLRIKHIKYKSLVRLHPHSMVWRFLLSGFLTFSQWTNGQVISIDEVIQTVKSNHPELKGREENIKAIQAYSKTAYSWNAPQVGAGFFMTPYQTQLWHPQTMMDGHGNSTNTPGMGQFMLQVQQMIPNPIRQNAALKYKSSLALVESENKDVRQNELIAVTKEAYYGIAIQQKILILLKQNEALASNALKSAEIRFGTDQDKLASIYTLEAKVLAIQNLESDIENTIQEKKITLNTLMNQDKMTAINIDTSISLVNFEDKSIDTIGITQQRSDLKSLDKQLQVNELNSNYQRIQLSPDFGIRYDHMFTFGTQPQLFTLMGMVNLPFVPWASRESNANRLALKHERAAIEWQQKSIKNEIVGRLETLRNQKRSKKKQYDQLGLRILPIMKKNYQTILFAFEQQQEDLSAVLDAWESLQEIQLQHLNLFQDLINLQIQYEKELQTEL
jgi:outer membrane protein TolC